MSPRSRQGQAGFTLVEVMVAVLILAVGLFGVIVAQVKSAQASQGAAQRSQANLLAADLFERMRSNPAHAFQYVKNYPCTAGGSVALVDYADWCTRLTAALPGATAYTAVKTVGAAFSIHYFRGMFMEVTLTLTIDDRSRLELNNPGWMKTPLVYKTVIIRQQ
jgi:type IV pilus assembly protein PilV